jgi:hypothetical protein
MDEKLVSNATYRHWVEAYAQDENLFFEHYATAHVKMSELG